MPKLFDEDGTPTINLFWLIVVIMIIICVTYYTLIRYIFLPGHGIEAWGQRGTVGDTFGTINALFTGAGFAGAIFVILLQRADLKRQQKESVEQAKKQREETARQVENFDKQLEQAKLQTQAILDQLHHHEEQTKAINEEAKESAKQTKELTRQIKLSIMPSFIVELIVKQKNNTYNGIMQPNYHEAKVTNIGNGLGANIVFDDIKLEQPGVQNMVAKVKQIAFLAPKKSIELNFSGNGFDIENKIPTPFDSRTTVENLYKNYNENNLYTLRLSFQDIEGTRYKQEIKIGANISIPCEIKKNK